ncbi:Ccc1 family [Protomyces lactucae-debilis]|uniref:Ccc1 family n=1 Tax=Protomyces lactucae-debilis TaxID=2754530 RepID=A0A1Y2EYN6_PROLT|nr:Ccc1 family [Protomyces lactucae-debilis]ORY76708.1 Ccc1 family [Protomyces lactucae-debilis]
MSRQRSQQALGQDGLTVPFALTAGLSSTGKRDIIILGGLAELVSGALSMGLGGYLAAQSEMEHYKFERQREQHEVVTCPTEEKQEIYDILEPYGLTKDTATPFVEELAKNPDQWVEFMLQFELGLSKPDTNRVWQSALAIGFAYLLGGIIPLLPYFFVENPRTKGLMISALLTSAVLVLFGYIKSFSVGRKHKPASLSAVQTLAVGAIAAAASYGVVYGLDRRFQT